MKAVNRSGEAGLEAGVGARINDKNVDCGTNGGSEDFLVARGCLTSRILWNTFAA